MLISAKIWTNTVCMERNVAAQGRVNQHVCTITLSAVNRCGLDVSLELKYWKVSLIQEER